MAFRAPIGISDFRTLREAGVGYVDKTGFVDGVLSDSAQVLLIPRPRRFGKTLNLSMLRCFLEKSREDVAPLFSGLEVARSSVAAPHFQRYPVIHLTFKDVKAATFPTTLSAVKLELQRLFSDHRYLLSGETLAPDEAARFQAILDRADDETLYWGALKDLSAWLSRYHQEKVVVLIDEYDTPIQAGYAQGFYESVLRFFRNFFSNALKDNPHLFKGVLTGVLRVARESLFSGLNNLAVYSLLSPRYATDFGFTEADVEGILAIDGRPERIESLRAWYNGYLFGGQVIYNPWSILSFIHAGDDEYRPYWVSTSSDDLLRELLLERGLGLSTEMERLLNGETVRVSIDENIVLRDVSNGPEAIWSFLLFSGYLKVVEARYEPDGLYGTVAIPNREVEGTFRRLFRSWLNRGLGGETRVQALLQALLSGHVQRFQDLLGELLLASGSYHQFGPRASEALYQAFILGLLVSLEPRFEVRSEQEEGYGRFDVMVTPRVPGNPGIVLELKVRDVKRRESATKALQSGLEQLRTRDYAAALRRRGADPIHEVAVVFDGKKVLAGKLEREKT